MNLKDHQKPAREEEQLQLSRRFFDSLNKGLLVLRVERNDSPALEVLDINPAAMSILGIAAPNFSLDDLPEWLSTLFDKEHAKQYAEVLRTGKERDLGEICRNGSAAHHNCFTIHAFPLSDLQVGILLEDISRHREAEETIVSLRALCARVHSTFDANRQLDALIEGSIFILRAESGVAGFCTTKGVSCYRYFYQGVLTAPEHCLTATGELSCRMIAADIPYRIDDAANDPRVDRERAKRFGVRNAIGTPIFDEQAEMVGFLELHNKIGASGFDTLDDSQLAVIAQIAAIAMKNSLHYQEMIEIGRILRESRERYQVLVEGIDAIVWEADSNMRRFSFVSPQAERILGYPVERWLNEPNFLLDKIHPHDRESVLSVSKSALERGEDFQLLYRTLAADGSYIWLHESVRVLKDTLGEITRLQGLMLDITATVKLEELLHKSESRFRSTFEGAGFGIVLLDRDEGFLESNPAFQSLVGYSNNEIRTKGIFSLTHPEDREAGLLQFRALMDGRIDRYRTDQRLIHKDGRIIWVQLSVSLVRNGFEAPDYAIGMVEDITESKKAGEEIAQLLEQVKQNAAELEHRVSQRTAQLAETNAELKTFAYSVSHDLRAPLRAVHGFAEILAGEIGNLSPEGKESVERILAAAQRMDLLIQNLLAYSRISRQEIVLHPVSLQKIVSEALTHLRLESGNKEYRIEVAEDLPEVKGHHAVLTQVVLNLLTNAIKFVAPGVTPELKIWAQQQGDWCRLFIKDNGIGISQEQQGRIFQIFERLHGTEAYPGTGVGLAIARKGVIRLGGRIGVESEPGMGSVFWIDLPPPSSKQTPP